MNQISPVKSITFTPRKVTRSISNFSGSSGIVGASHGKITTRREGASLVVCGLNPEILQLYDYEDQKKASARQSLTNVDQRAERRARRSDVHDPTFASLPGIQSKRKRASLDGADDDNDQNGDAPPAKQTRRQASRLTNGLEAPPSQLDGSFEDLQNGVDSYGGHETPKSKDNASDHASFPARAPLVSKRGGILRRRRRGGGQVSSKAASREPTPPLTLLAPEDDMLSDSDLPSPFTTEHFDDPNLPDDEAQELYCKIYEPMSLSTAFTNVLTKYRPDQRSTDNLYVLAANTAAALRAWQDEYLALDRITAPHAAIPRKPATGQRNPLDPQIFEDMKESDLYDYVFDPKKIGFQDPIAQRVVRDASGRELRTRQPRGQSNINASSAAASADDIGPGRRAPRPVSKYDGTIQTTATRKRAAAAMSETPEVEPAAKRGRLGLIRGRGGKRGGRGGRGGLLGKRIQEMRAESVATATTASEDDMSGSEAGNYREDSLEAAAHATGTPGPDSGGENDLDNDGDSDEGVSMTANGKRKGRPKGSKNHHKRSDAGIPKGPRVPKAAITTDNNNNVNNFSTSQQSPLASPSIEQDSPSAAAASSTDPKRKPPRSEKRSQSMVEWWARRKAKAAEEKAREQAEQETQRQTTRAQVLPPQPHYALPPMHSSHNQGVYTGPYGPPPGSLPPHVTLPPHSTMPPHSAMPPPGSQLPPMMHGYGGWPPPPHGYPPVPEGYFYRREDLQAQQQHQQHQHQHHAQAQAQAQAQQQHQPHSQAQQQQQQGQSQYQQGQQHGGPQGPGGLRLDSHGFVRSF